MKIFGFKEKDKTYIQRQAVYGICLNGDSIATVKVRSSNFLPGGGIEASEKPKEALIREFKEELGWNIEISKELCSAKEFFSSFKGDKYYDSEAKFFLVRFIDNKAIKIEENHILEWIKYDNLDKLKFEYFKWAAAKAIKDII